ncbi:serine hydrolase domain-containing protein [Flavobacterium sp.]|uniref:serine hydrolase domain-containing protein n=1 Tax=Flavobacterium sp. TaxID=239 RepID=UPI0035270603
MKKSSLFLLLLLVFACKKEEKQPMQPFVSIPKKIDAFPVNFHKNNPKEIAKLKQEIKQFYQSKINIDNFSGQFLVAKNGKILFEDVQGFSNYEQKQKLTKNTPLHLASISKVLTAAVVLRFVDEGKLKLDDSFKNYFPEFPYEKVTICTLLNHRSGLPNYLHVTDDAKIWKKNKMLTNEALLNLLQTKNLPLEFKTNTKFSYNNTNYALLALVIEKISGLSFPEAMQKLLFEPLQMKNSFVFEYEKQKDTVSHSYKSTWEKIPYDNLDAVYGDKNIYSTVEDLLKFDNATYSKDFFSDSLRNEIFKGYSYEKPGVKNYGLGIRLNEWDNYTTLFYHNGWWHGNTTSYTTLKNDTVAIFCLSNKYTRKVYQAKALSSLFGNYPFEIEDD